MQQRAASSSKRDFVLNRGFSLHFFDDLVALYSGRVSVVQGYAQLRKADLLALVKFFDDPRHRRLLEGTEAAGGSY